MGGTYGGNAVACAAAIATLDVFEEERVLANVADRSKEATASLAALRDAVPAVADVRAPGLMIGVEFGDDYPGIAAKVAKECEANGLLVLPTGVHQAVRLIPPLTVDQQDMATAMSVFSDAVTTVANQY